MGSVTIPIIPQCKYWKTDDCPHQRPNCKKGHIPGKKFRGAICYRPSPVTISAVGTGGGGSGAESRSHWIGGGGAAYPGKMETGKYIGGRPISMPNYLRVTEKCPMQPEDVSPPDDIMSRYKEDHDQKELNDLDLLLTLVEDLTKVIQSLRRKLREAHKTTS